jgi:Flp pilus assembly protein TadB
MNWVFYVIFGGSIAVALLVAWLGWREQRQEKAGQEKA